MTRRTSRKPVRRNSRRRTSRGLRRLRRNSSTYYSVHIPYSKTPTVWHPDRPDGPFSTLSRGKFSTVQEAHDWAQERLGHKPVYKVVPHTLEENSRIRKNSEMQQFELKSAYSDPSAAHEKCMKIKSAGGKNVLMRKGSDGRWTISFVADAETGATFGAPRTLERNSRARYTRDWRQIGGSHRDPADQGTNREGLTWNEWRAAAGTGGLTTAVLLAAWRAGEDPTEYRAMKRNGKALTAAMADEIVAYEYRPIDHAFVSQKLSALARSRGFKTPTGCDTCNLARGEHPSARDAAAIAAAIARAHGRLNRNPRRRRSRGRR